MRCWPAGPVNSLGGGHERDLEIVPAAIMLARGTFQTIRRAPAPAAPSAPVPLTISAEFPMRAKGA